MKNRIIYDNYNTDIDNWDFEEELTDAEKYDRMYDELDVWYDDEKINLDVTLPGHIIAIADLGLWDGRHKGYKILNDNLNCVLDSFNCEYMVVWQDRYNVKSKLIHHDGINYILFRQLRPGLGYWDIEHFQWLLQNGKASERDIRRYTVSLNPEIDKIYGKV